MLVWFESLRSDDRSIESWTLQRACLDVEQKRVGKIERMGRIFRCITNDPDFPRGSAIVVTLR